MKLNLDRPVIFLATDRPDRSRMFYEKTLGLEFIPDEPYALVFQMGGCPLRIQKVDRLAPTSWTVLGWEVKDIEATLRELGTHGVCSKEFAFLDQNERGVWDSPSGSKIAWFEDPCGNLLSITESLKA